jgi:hypothetical protein
MDDLVESARKRGNLFLRLWWMMIGLIALGVMTGVIAMRAPWSFSGLDAAFWALVAGVLVARWVDGMHLHGLTSDGSATTPRGLVAYAATLLGVCTAAWLLAHAVEV